MTNPNCFGNTKIKKIFGSTEKCDKCDVKNQCSSKQNDKKMQKYLERIEEERQHPELFEYNVSENSFREKKIKKTKVKRNVCRCKK